MIKETLNVSEFIDEKPLGSYQVFIIAVCATIAMLDGFDTQSIAFVAPYIIESWGVSASLFGPIFGSGLLGLTVGAMVFGTVSDTHGRKLAIIVSTFIFGFFALLTTTSNSVESLIIYRFLTGIGLGGCMPNIIALSSEFSPQRLRSTMITVMFCGFPLGAVLGGIISSYMIPLWGWKSVFYLGGTLPLLLLPFLVRFVPESIRYLVSRGEDVIQIRKILLRIDPKRHLDEVRCFELTEKNLTDVSFLSLFSDGRGWGTVLIWIMFFMNLLMLYFLINWLPTLLNQSGFSADRAIIGTVVLNAAGILGGLAVARYIDARGPYHILTVVYLSAAVFTAITGAVNGGINLVLWLIAIVGFCVIGAQLGANALAVGFYPTAIRATGVGWALGIGRLGAIVGPVVGGVAISSNWTTETIFIVVAIPALVAACAVFIMGRMFNPSLDNKKNLTRQHVMAFRYIKPKN